MKEKSPGNISTQRNIALKVQYDGSVFHGWQRQLNLATVQEEVERGLAKLTKTEVTLHGAGRTDTGVHALSQWANFQTQSTIPTDKWCLALNSVLPQAIRVVAAEEKSGDWHARFTPHWKHYRYSIEQTSIGSPMRRNFYWQRHGDLNFQLLQEAAALVVGSHNFKAFCASGSKVKDHQRLIRESSWQREDNFFYYDVQGNGFLYNMVRLLVGAMTDIASGKWTIAAMQEALTKGERHGTVFCAPPQGLCLQEIFYEN